MNEWFESERGQKFCSETCFSETFPKCSICRKPMQQWQENEKGQKFCSDKCSRETLPKCSVCHKPMQQWQENEKGQKFCSESCAKTTWAKCSVCSTPMNQWITDTYGTKFCSEKCFSHTFPTCDCCGKKMKEWTTFEDGKKCCSEKCSEQSLPKCNACGTRMKNWRETENGHKYCSERCLSTAYPKCDACGSSMSSWHELENGHKFCSEKCLTKANPTAEIQITLPIGSHLVTPRMGYTHHGIYVGNGDVIHYSGLATGLSAGAVEITTLELFKNGEDVQVREYKNPKYKGIDVVNRAKTRLGEDKYDLHGNNCEHFCTWAITGRSNSEQVNIAEDIMDVLLPNTLLTTILKARKHHKQGYNATDIAKDVADIGAKTAILSAAQMIGSIGNPAILPMIATYKVIKWVFK